MKKIKCKLNKKVNKKGFTLVELLVCVAIIAVIAMICAQFVSHSTNAYRRTASTTKIQETCQDALNQVANIVRNSKLLTVKIDPDTKGIVMESKNYENKNIRLEYVPSDDELEDFGKIYVCYDYQEIDENDNIVNITFTDPNKEYNEYLLTDMVTDFTISKSTYNKYLYDDEGNHEINADGKYAYEPVEQDRVVDLSLTLERNGRSYTHSFKAALRNSSLEDGVTELVIYFGNNNETPEEEPEE